MSMRVFRSLFPQLNKWTFLDSAMQGLTPPVLSKEGNRVLRDYVWLQTEDAHALPAGVKAKLASLLKVNSEEIALTGSTTQGLNIMASALPLRGGLNVVVSACEHPSNLYPWTNLRRLGVDVRLVPSADGVIRAEDFAPYVDKNTVAISASLVSFYPGGILETQSFSKLARSVGSLFIIDAAQALGFMPVYPEEIGADILVAPSYKGLMSGHGGGFIYVRQDIISLLEPSHLYIQGPKGDHGIRSGLTPPEYELADTAVRFEVNTVPDTALVQMNKALDILSGLGLENISAHSTALCGKLAQGLSDLGFMVEPAGKSHIVCIRHARAKELEVWLKQQSVYASARRFGLRFGLFAYNNQTDVDRALEVLAKWPQSRR